MPFLWWQWNNSLNALPWIAVLQTLGQQDVSISLHSSQAADDLKSSDPKVVFNKQVTKNGAHRLFIFVLGFILELKLNKCAGHIKSVWPAACGPQLRVWETWHWWFVEWSRFFVLIVLTRIDKQYSVGKMWPPVLHAVPYGTSIWHVTVVWLIPLLYILEVPRSSLIPSNSRTHSHLAWFSLGPLGKYQDSLDCATVITIGIVALSCA
jgi:hypothetical protein